MVESYNKSIAYNNLLLKVLLVSYN